MTRLTTGSALLDWLGGDTLFQHHRYARPFVPLTERLELVNHTATRPVIDPELAGWLRAYLAFAEQQVLSGALSADNAERNVDEITHHFSPAEIAEHCQRLGLEPLGPQPPVHGPCFPPPYRLYPHDDVSPRPRGQRCGRCGSIWVSSGMGGSCCNECGAFH